MKISYAPDAWKLLRGLFCVYKPAEVSLNGVKRRIAYGLCRDLNAMKTRPPEKYVKIEDDPSSETGLSVTNLPSYADNPLVVGPRYHAEDMVLGWASNAGFYTSGVCVFGINCGMLLRKFAEGRYLRAYQICGRFGMATEDFHENGKILQKTTFGHITRAKIDQVLASVMAAHQKHMFHYSGVDIKSQIAYDLASKGPIRPSANSPPLIYGIKCIDFQPPEFTVELECINETENYVMGLIHEVGLMLKSTAVCTKVRQTRYGKFSLDHALLRKHWTIEHIINCISRCKGLVDYKMPEPSEANFMVSDHKIAGTQNK